MTKLLISQVEQCITLKELHYLKTKLLQKVYNYEPDANKIYIDFITLATFRAMEIKGLA